MSAYFSTLEIKIRKIVEKVIESQDLCKLIYYNQPNPLDQPDITDTSILIMDKIFPLPKYSFSETDKGSRINIYFKNSQPYENNSGFRQIILCIDVICHDDVWIIDNSGIRPYALSNKIDEIFNNQFVADLSMKNIFFRNWGFVEYADFFHGYTLIYELSDNSNVGCG